MRPPSHIDVRCCVAQIFNPLYRGLEVCGALVDSLRPDKSSAQPSATRRNGRVQACATTRRFVAQIFNLLYRRVALGDAPANSSAPEFADTLQDAILRYGRVQLCATAREFRQRGSVLVGLLWCLALLSVVVIGVLYTARLDLRVVKNYGDQIQAHYLALAGIEKAKAMLYHEAGDRKRSARNHSGELYDSPRDFRDVPFGRGQFRVFRQARADEGGGIVFGITDEESRLNANTASDEELRKLYGMTPDVAASIIDFRDEDNTVTPGGAEAEYYASFQPPYLPRNGPFQTLRELLMVKGVTRELFAGEDANLNGLLDPEEDDGDASDPPDNRDGILDAGWSELLTVDSTASNLNATGQERVNVQSADESTLAGVRGFSTDIARAIVASRGQNQIESLADLLEVAAPNSQNQILPEGNAVPNQPGAVRTRGAGPQPNNAPAQPTGPRVISEDLLMEVADDLTAGDGEQKAGAVNINTAGPKVLACLPGVDEQLAQAIVSYRKSAGYFPNIAWLLKVPGMNRQIFKQLAPKVTARSETFRIVSEGKVNSTGARKRIQAIVRLGSYSIDTLSYREDL